MSDRKGIFTSSQEDFLAQVLDDFFAFNNGLFETFDKTVFKTVIKVVDNKAIDLLKESWKEDLIKLVDAAMSFDVELTRAVAAKILNKEIDIPEVSEAAEAEVFDAFTVFLVRAMVWYVNKK